MRPSREWAEVKADFDCLIKSMGGEELYKAEDVMKDRVIALEKKYSIEAVKTFKVGDKVKYFSAPIICRDASEEPDAQGVVKEINLEKGIVRVEKEGGRRHFDRAINVRKIEKV